MSKLAAFYEARDCYNEFVNYTKPLTFDEWSKKPHSEKAVLLFLQYFPEILSAWSKANSFDFIDGEDGVSIVCQYLEKNVSIIEKEPQRFTPRYIYKIAYNCMYCICHDLVSVQNRWKYEIPSSIKYGEDDLDLYDILYDDGQTVESVCEANELHNEFWSIIEDMGFSAEKVMRYLLSDRDESQLKKITPRTRAYKDGDPLRDVEVTIEEVDGILAKIREKLLSLSINSPCGAYVHALTA